MQHIPRSNSYFAWGTNKDVTGLTIPSAAWTHGSLLTTTGCSNNKFREVISVNNRFYIPSIY